MSALAAGTTLEVVGPYHAADGWTWRNVRTPDGRARWIAGALVESIAPPAAAAPPVAVASPFALEINVSARAG